MNQDYKSLAKKFWLKLAPAAANFYINEEQSTAYLLSIYDKSELENLTNSEILDLIKLIP